MFSLRFQPLFAKNGILWSDAEIPGKRDQCYGPPPRKRFDDDDFILVLVKISCAEH